MNQFKFCFQLTRLKITPLVNFDFYKLFVKFCINKDQIESIKKMD